MRSDWQLFQPGKIGQAWAKNRIVMAPMDTNLASSSGEVSERLLAYYRQRAYGGAGTIIVEAASVDAPLGRASWCQINIDHPRCITGLKRLSSSIQASHCLAFIQISHSGRQAYRTVTEGLQPVAPSAIPCPIVQELPRAMDRADIQRAAAKFADAADYAAEAGFDGIELHACHGYLINQFLSPHANHRIDEYGGSLENRQRFLLDILQEIKRRQPGLLVSVRINIDDFVDGGLTMEDSLQVCRSLEQRGADVIHASSGTYASGLMSIESGSFPEGWRLYLAAAVKQNVQLPVIGGGMIASPAMAEKAVADGQADFVFIGRSLLADPFWPLHAARGSEELNRPCIRCNNCIDSMFKGLTINCTVNPQAGREIENSPRRDHTGFSASSAHEGQVPSAWIAGAGPAGLHAALALAESGVGVRIFDRSAEAGGLMSRAARPPFKDRISQWREYLVEKLQRYDVEWRLGEAFIPSMLEQENPDLLVLAVGARMAVPAIEGIDSGHCVDALTVLDHPELLDGRQIAILGGGLTGCELADLASGRAAEVSIIEQSSTLAGNMEKKNRRSLLNRLNEAGIHRHTRVRALAVRPEGVIVQAEDGEQITVSADLVVLAAGFESVADPLARAVQGRVPLVYTIGDARRPRGFKEAVLEGHLAAERFLNTWNAVLSAGAFEIPGDGKGIVAD